MSKHTPGPWTKDRNIIEDAEGQEIARVAYEQSGYVQANARLIAAAPELLKALKAIIEGDWVNVCHIGRYGEGETLKNTARAAIEKATA